MSDPLLGHLACLIGFHVWGGHDSPGPGSWRACARCGKYQEGAYDGISPHWATRRRPTEAEAAIRTPPGTMGHNDGLTDKMGG